MKHEASFQSIFNNYLRSKKLHGYFELKATKYLSLPFDAVEQHQIESLRAAEMMGLVFKISDMDIRIKPFDCLSTPPLQAYIAIKYHTFFAVITLDAFLKERDASSRKSLAEQRAKDIATYVCAL